MTIVLVVDDEPDIRELLRYNLEKERYQVREAKDGNEALAAVRKEPPHVVVLDLMMPGLDGLEVLRRIRADADLAHIPVIILTAKDGITDRIVGLEVGADDYVVKPFSPREVVSRVKAVLRRVQRAEDRPAVLTAGPIRIDSARRAVVVHGVDVGLTTTQFNVLRSLAERPGRALTRNQLISAAIGEDAAVTDRTIDAHVAALRRKLGPEAGAWIETLRGFGYRFREG